MANTELYKNSDARILLTDDDPRMLESLKTLLELYEFNVDTALGGQEGIDKLSSQDYDVLLLDLKMPDINGHDVMAFMAKHQINTTTIVVSGETSLSDISKALRHGAYDYLKKPYVPEELTATVSNAVRKKLLEKSHQNIQSKLNQSEKLHRFIVNNSPDIIFVLDSQGKVSFINSQIESILGFSRKNLMGKPITNIIDDNDERVSFFFERALAPHKTPQSTEVTLKNFNNEHKRHFEITIWSISDTNERIPSNSEHFHAYGTARDITERKEAEAFINFQAYHDLLTRLPNRSLFKDRLSTAISQAERNNSRLAVMFIDLDRFKVINDSLGHTMGDRLLQAVSQRLQQHIRKSDTLSRFGGDEFTLLLPEIADDQAAIQVADKILESIKQPFILGGHDIYVGASIGIATYPEAGTNMDALIKNSDIAMYQVKNTGKDGVKTFNPEMSDNPTERLMLEQDIRRAIELNEFDLCYQPQVDTLTQTICGVEALIRWNHPSLGRLSPVEFIPIAEESRLIIDIDKYTLRKACREIRHYHHQGMPNLRLAVNLSPIMIEREDFVETVLGILKDEGFPTNLLELEITENVLMGDRKDIIDKLLLLSSKGINLALDDFGTGYSSLSYLQKFPLKTLKIDRSFIHNIKSSEDEACIVNAIISMAQGLRMSIIAEGVENKEQLDYLKALGCDIVQGFFFGAATSLEQVATLFHQRQHLYTTQIAELGA
ncbi:EAL domain-containing protein [Dasania sp. GY-MA-18]|uniref:EAL domain-containing protein n=1 Tax=Dasania phycosphaerae TaxID=2950436 RepID=A0A9J6RHA9_9GAMM|nr:MULTISPECIES: EAL domain-containing protein [Dasania]MCR8921171.1 EAL domain-containing protein [Dasania sp. GY-MA-18]MCZ0863599.1 EAL domain-containing protein [Dasania phycosphaerae]MCZ0867327.1 EAL domain-containing protein [Dasania phycosphaerae]